MLWTSAYMWKLKLDTVTWQFNYLSTSQQRWECICFKWENSYVDVWSLIISGNDNIALVKVWYIDNCFEYFLILSATYGTDVAFERGCTEISDESLYKCQTVEDNHGGKNENTYKYKCTNAKQLRQPWRLGQGWIRTRISISIWIMSTSCTSARQLRTTMEVKTET